MRIRGLWAGLVFLAIPACGPPPQTIDSLPPGAVRELKADENNPAEAVGETGESSTASKATVGVEETLTPPPIKPIAEHTTPSGLKIAILQNGPGPEAVKGQEVDIRYTAWVDGGKLFDSTQQKKALYHFVLGAGDVLKGLDEGVEGMKVGERRRLTVPPALGYGEKGQSSLNVPANATLIYDIDLVGDASPGEFVKTAPGTQPDTAPEVKPLSERTTPSGLKIAVLKEGTGAVAQKGQIASVHYTGWLLEGGKFDSSRDRNSPFPFPIGGGQVIAGWDEGVEGMKVGERRRLTLPPNLAYGSRAQSKIPANSTLVFDVELMGLNEPLKLPGMPKVIP